MKSYLLLQLKRSLRILPGVAVISAVLLVMVSVFWFGYSSSRLSEDSRQKISLGLVGDMENSPELRLGLYALETFDQTKYTIDLKPMSEAEAKRELMQGGIKAYILIPEGFVQSVGSYRDDRPIRYVSTDGAVGIGTQFIDEIVRSLSELLIETQSTIYGMQTIVHEISPEERVDILGDEMLFRYGKLALNRESFFDLREVGIRDELSLQGKIAAGLMAFFMLLWGISASLLHLEEHPALFRLLQSQKGLRAQQQILCEGIAPFSLMGFVVAVIFMVLWGWGRSSGMLPEMMEKTLPQILFDLFLLIPAIIFCVLFHQTVFEGLPSTFARLCAIFVVGVLMGYLCGFFYPAEYFPESVHFLGRILPGGALAGWIASLILGSPDWISLLWLILWSGFSFALCSAFRQRRIRL